MILTMMRLIFLSRLLKMLKYLDPACGSGAFPMGALQKLVYILHKLDVDNQKWKSRQIIATESIPDLVLKENQLNQIEESFNLKIIMLIMVENFI